MRELKPLRASFARSSSPETTASMLWRLVSSSRSRPSVLSLRSAAAEPSEMRTSLDFGVGVVRSGRGVASIVSGTLAAAPLTRQPWRSTRSPARAKAMTTSSAPTAPDPPRRFPVAWSNAARSQSLPSPPVRRAAKNDVADGVHDVVVTPGRPARGVGGQLLRITADGELSDVLRAGAAWEGAARRKDDDAAAARAASAGPGLIEAGTYGMRRTGASGASDSSSRHQLHAASREVFGRVLPVEPGGG